MCIAEHTWIRCPAGKIFLYKIIDHKTAEFIPYIENVMRKSMLYRCHAGIIEAIHIAATRFFFTTAAAGIVPCFHGDTHHFITFIMKHESSDGTGGEEPGKPRRVLHLR